jgi:regulator of RNase E activity RraA
VAAINMAITIHTAAGLEVIINPEDIIVADWDGVVVISPELIEQAVRIMGVSTFQDQRCMEDLIHGHGVGETFKKHRGH